VSKWNEVEYRLFRYISKSWQGKSLVDVVIVVNLISSTTACKGFRVVCQSDGDVYLWVKKVDDREFGAINISRILPHGEWNYIIFPTK